MTLRRWPRDECEIPKGIERQQVRDITSIEKNEIPRALDMKNMILGYMICHEVRFTKKVITQKLLNKYETLLLNGYEPVTKGLLNGYKTITKRLPKGY